MVGEFKKGKIFGEKKWFARSDEQTAQTALQ